MRLNMYLKVALQSLGYRRNSVVLTVLAIAVSVFVLVGVEHIQRKVKDSFGNTVSGVDLIVGARSGEINLLLYSVFRIGNATHNMSWESYQALVDHEKVAWAVPLAMGDSHRGFQVVGTTTDYFTYYHYAQRRALQFHEGRPFAGLFDVVLGAEVARKLGYSLQDPVILAHGTVQTSFSQHRDFPFVVSGILARTGTPVDNALYVSLAGLEAIHDEQPADASRHNSHTVSPAQTPASITAAMVGLNSKIATFQVQRQINQEFPEPLQAILPGVALAKLWQVSGTLEKTLQLVSGLMLTASLLGLCAVLLATLRERQREIAILRMLGAQPLTIFGLIEVEVFLIAGAGSIIGIASLYAASALGQGYIAANYGLFIGYEILTSHTFAIVVGIIGGAALVGILPAAGAYRRSRRTGL